MNTIIKERIFNEARYIILYDATIRDCAEYFEMSKTNIHRDMRKVLPKLSNKLYVAVDKVLAKNMKERASRGGQALARKHKQI